MFFYVFFCFQQKTAYELRIGDWSSDVCSSDLRGQRLADLARHRVHGLGDDLLGLADRLDRLAETDEILVIELGDLGELQRLLRIGDAGLERRKKLGSASCRERVCKYG